MNMIELNSQNYLISLTCLLIRKSSWPKLVYTFLVFLSASPEAIFLLFKIINTFITKLYLFTFVMRSTHLEENNLGYPQRRKMFHLHDRHNLKSSVELLWLNSLEQNNMKGNVIEEKKHNGAERIIQNYNSFIQKQLNQKYKGDDFATIGQKQQIQTKKRSGNSYRQQANPTRNKSFSSQSRNSIEDMDTSLNQHVEQFQGRNSKKMVTSGLYEDGLSSSRLVREKDSRVNQGPIFQEIASLSPKFLKQHLLRSAFDPYNIYSGHTSGEYQKIRNIMPDPLYQHLRPNQKKPRY